MSTRTGRRAQGRPPSSPRLWRWSQASRPDGTPGVGDVLCRGRARQPAPADANALVACAELGAHHPELLLELAQHLDPDILRRQIELAEPLEPLAQALGDVA